MHSALKTVVSLFTCFLYAGWTIAQCPYSGAQNGPYDANTLTVGNRVLMGNAVWGGEYFTVHNMDAAAQYTIDLCGSPSNTNLTLYPESGGSVIAFSEDDCGDDGSITFYPPSSGSYRFIMYQSPGCQTLFISESMYITLVSAPPSCTLSASITGQSNVSCNGGSDGSLTATASNGTTNYSYSWSNGATTNNTPSTTNTITGLVAGTYTVTITDNNSCTATASSTISQPTIGLSVSTNVNNHVSCSGGSDGSVSATPSGGTPSYTYSWSNAGTTATVSGLSAGTYTVTVTDANGCTQTDAATVNSPTPLSGGTIGTGP